MCNYNTETICSASIIDLTKETTSESSSSCSTTNAWVKCSFYTLSSDDKDDVLSKEGRLNNRIIAAAQSLLCKDFPNIRWLQLPKHPHMTSPEANLLKFSMFIVTTGV